MGTVLAAVLAFAPGADPSAPAPGYVAGRVVDLAGQPIRNVKVGLHGLGGEDPNPATTAADGTFKLGPLSPGANYRAVLFADADGFGRELALAPAVLPGATTQIGDLLMSPGRLYTGVVTTEQGAAIPNAHVQCQFEFNVNRYTSANIGSPIDLVADADGKYTLPALPVGTAHIRYAAPDRQRGMQTLRVEPGDPTTAPEIFLPAGITYRGRAVDEDGKAVAGAVIDPFDLRAVSGADGRFVLAGFGPQWRARDLPVLKVGFLPGKFTGAAGEVEVKLLRAGWFAGRAVDADTGAAVRLDRASYSVAPKPEGPAGPALVPILEQPEPGTFRVRFAAPGEYTVALSAAGYASAEFKVTADARKTIEVPAVKMKKLAVPPGPAGAGTVALGGKPVKSGWAVLYRMTQPKFAADLLRNRPVAPTRYAYAEAEVTDGTFTLIPRGTAKDWFVAVYVPGRAPTIVGPLELADGKPAEVKVEIAGSGAVAGVVGDVPAQYDGHLWVVAFATNGFRAETRVRVGGKFAFPALPPGEYGLKVGHNAFKDEEVLAEEPKAPAFKIQPPADPWKRALKVTLKAGETVTVKDLTLPEK
jgi:hypothetical protein